jgi:hypothetical protein
MMFLSVLEKFKYLKEGSYLFDLILPVVSIVMTSIWARKNYLENKKTKKDFYWNFFIKQYLDASFKFKSHKIELKEGRLKLKEKYKGFKDDEYIKFLDEVKKDTPPTYENKLAHRLSVVLNRIGQAAFTGDLPLDNIFPISSKMILKDWHTSKTLIKEIDGPRLQRNSIYKNIFQMACVC